MSGSRLFYAHRTANGRVLTPWVLGSVAEDDEEETDESRSGVPTVL